MSVPKPDSTHGGDINGTGWDSVFNGMSKGKREGNQGGAKNGKEFQGEGKGSTGGSC